MVLAGGNIGQDVDVIEVAYLFDSYSNIRLGFILLRSFCRGSLPLLVRLNNPLLMRVACQGEISALLR